MEQMKGKIILSTTKRQMLDNILLIGIMVVLCFVSFIRYKETKTGTFYQKVRILLADEIAALNQEREADSSFSYLCVNLAGRVTKSNRCDTYEIGDSINLTELIQNGDMIQNELGKKTVVFPQKGDRKITGFYVFFVDENLLVEHTQGELLLHTFSPIIIGSIMLILVMVFRTLWLQKNMISPMKHMTASTEAIIKGNYDIQISEKGRIKSHETKQLVSDFELMRDEMKAQTEKEVELKKSEKELISCISHDLRTPLATMKAYTEGIRDGLAEDKEKRQQYLETILSKIAVISQMLGDLLEISSAELNELRLSKKEIYFKDYYSKLMNELSSYVLHGGYCFEADVNLPNVITHMDETRITQVIYNIVENSMKYLNGKEDGKISICCKCTEQNKYLQIIISDNGKGLSLEDIPYVFHKFYRAEKSRNQQIAGSGLGLSICKYIVDAHGGTISCKNNKEGGAEFSFTLPIV